MGLAGVILGVLACLFALLPVYGPLITVPLAVAGIALSAIFLTRARKKKDRKGCKVARIGLILSIVSLPVMVINTVSRW